MNGLSKEKLSHIALFVVSLIWAANYTIAKEIMPEYIKPFGLVALRVFVISIIFILIYKITKRKKRLTKNDALKIFYSALFGIVINKLLFFKGLSITEPITASFIMTSTPIIVFILSYLTKNTRILKINVLGLIISWIAVIGLIFENNNDYELSINSGAIMLLLSAAAYAYHLILLKDISKEYDTISMMTLSLIFGSIFIVPIGFDELTKVVWVGIPLNIWSAIIFVLLFATLGTYFLTMWAINNVEAHTVGIYSYIQPILATIIAVILESDVLSIKKIILGTIIIIGVYLVNKRSQYNGT